MTTTTKINPTTTPTMINTADGTFPLGAMVVASAVGRPFVNGLVLVGLFGVDAAGAGLTVVEGAVVPLVAVEIVADEVFVVETAGIVVFVTEVAVCEVVVVDFFAVELDGVDVSAIEVVAVDIEVDIADVEFVRLIPSGRVLVAEIE